MRITRTAEQVIAKREKLENIIREAREGCDKCPCCGSGSYSITRDFIYTGLFLNKTYRIDKYECCKCEARWESEPYPYGDKEREILKDHSVFVN